PPIKAKSKLVTTGVYGIIRNPLYTSNYLLAVSMAILFNRDYHGNKKTLNFTPV
ncbi:MAG: hypothetical protein JRI26_13545, partial [Deltaproteobacteria bacterium]|nr:hypothetical protein [Deltaproteobacteria bacterium]